MKRLFCTILAILLAVLFAGCGAGLPDIFSELPFSNMPSLPGDPNPMPGGPDSRGQGTVYYNVCLGLSMQVMQQDYIVEINASNLGTDRNTCRTLNDFDWDNAGDGYQATLLIISTSDDSTLPEHAGMWLFAEYYPDWTHEEYIEEFGYWLDEDTDVSEYTLEGVDTTTINGREYTRFLARVDSMEGYDTYYEEYYVTPVSECYLIAEVDYWPDNRRSYEDAMAYLGRFELEGRGSPDGNDVFDM